MRYVPIRVVDVSDTSMVTMLCRQRRSEINVP